MADERKTPRLMQKDLGLHDFTHRTWTVMLQEGQKLEDTLDPRFWATVAQDPNRSPRKHDKVEIRHIQGLFFATLMVMDSGEGWLRAELIGAPTFFKANDVEVAETASLIPKWKVATKSWSVVRKVDGHEIKAGFGTKSAAQAWIDDHQQKAAA